MIPITITVTIQPTTTHQKIQERRITINADSIIQFWQTVNGRTTIQITGIGSLACLETPDEIIAKIKASHKLIHLAGDIPSAEYIKSVKKQSDEKKVDKVDRVDDDDNDDNDDKELIKTILTAVGTADRIDTNDLVSIMGINSFSKIKTYVDELVKQGKIKRIKEGTKNYFSINEV